ncbi:MAG: ABC transporter ATP-binding protein [Bacteroidales bacterium]|jgi:peptide/nickel transport system ATP-binding protein|nr:ABC transporter ATP-binding protein [Bacteroidales bacterium]
MATNFDSNKPILEVADLRISFLNDGEWHQVIKGINFSIGKGGILGLVGESGSGKSVSSLAIMGLLPSKISRIDSGNIWFNADNEKDLAKIISAKEYSKIRGRQIAMIFQEPMTALNPVLRCGNQVAEVLHSHTQMTSKEAKAKVLNLFEEVLLPNPQRVFRAYPHQLSGGQKQRVMIAMALACEPDLLIADEPTTALDVTVEKAILELLKDLQERRNIAVLFITHDLAVIRKIADNVAVIYKGEIVEQGNVESIFANPQHIYTKALLASRPPKNARPKRLLSVSDFINNTTETSFVTDKERQQEHKMLYDSDPLLKVSNLTVKYKHTTAVNNVSLEVYRGETLGLVGESGCGKTTIGRSILQLIDNQSGDVIFDNQNLALVSAKQMQRLRQRIQIIFQDPYSSLNPRMKIGKAIEEVLDVHNIGTKSQRKQRVLQMLEKVGLEREHYERYPHQFSGGQRQRIGIARALILNPELVICDESVSALDVSVQAQVLNLLNDLKREFAFTFIFISHDLAVVKYMSDRILVMKSGVIVEQNEADTLYLHPQNAYTKTLIAAIP